MLDTAIINALVVTSYGNFQGGVGIENGRIVALGGGVILAGARETIDAQGQVLLPGIIDPHTHYHYGYGYRPNDRDYMTESRSAAIGGITSAMRMHREVTSYDGQLEEEIRLIDKQSFIDVGLHVGIVIPEHLEKIHTYVKKFGVMSFKMFMPYKGEEGRRHGIMGADDGFLLDAMRVISSIPGATLVLHCENSEIIERATAVTMAEGRNDLAAWDEARPSVAEGEAILRAAYLAKKTGCRVCIAHVSSADGVQAVEDARRLGMKLFAETCVQYLTLSTDDPDLSFLAKINPPIRSRSDVETLWKAVERGVFETIATDHCAHTRAKLADTIWDTRAGFPGSATLLAGVLTEGYHKNRLSLTDLARYLSGNAASIFNMHGKGAIEVGNDADLTLVNLDLARRVTPELLGSASDFSVFEGKTLKGWATLTMVRGKVVMQDGRLTNTSSHGCYIWRNNRTNATGGLHSK